FEAEATAPEESWPGEIGGPPIEVRTSARRRKSSAAFFEGGRIVVVVPEGLSESQTDAVVERLSRRLAGRSGHSAGSDVALSERARMLSQRYLGGVSPSSIRWVSNQKKRWASCTPVTGEIRVSRRLTLVPDWVLDAVLVHELAHLIDPTHSAGFRRLADRYPRRAEADAFLAGLHLGTAVLGPAPALAPDPFDADVAET
ncbi:MAG: M48 metallopeptidase family protein, partial [Acidimicrobiales bacterium]